MRGLWRRIFAVFALALLITLSHGPLNVQAAAAEAEHPVNIYLFWGEGCPHCAKAKPVLEDIDKASDAVKLYKYEVYYNYTNQQLLKSVAAALHINASGVPVIVIGDEAFVGYSDASKVSIVSRVNTCTAKGCPDSVASIVGVEAPRQTVPDSQDSATESQQQTAKKVETVNLPLFGEVHVKDFSLPVLTVIIAALDGFNPCAMWTLIFLISLLLGMHNRRRMWLLGSSFIGASALVYLLFLAAWLNIFLFLGMVTWVRLLIGLVALGAGGYYLYDFWNNRNGTCKVTGGERRQAVFAKIRAVIAERSIWLALAGIVLLAAAVNLVELVCSAGLPAVYTSILSGTGMPTWEYYAYLLLYILVFMADDLFVFFMAMFTLKLTGLQGSYARYAHLIGGVLMLVLGALLILAPQLLLFG